MSAHWAPWIDLLTGAWRREHFEEQLAHAVVDARRHGAPLCVLYLDVDDLFEHNDVHGRAAVDGALGWMVSRVSQIVDGRGPIGRVGGDEFAVILPGTTPEQALALSEELRRQIPRVLHASAFGDYRLTVSVGVAALRRDEPFGNLLEAASVACTRAKQRGRDAVVAR